MQVKQSRDRESEDEGHRQSPRVTPAAPPVAADVGLSGVQGSETSAAVQISATPSAPSSPEPLSSALEPFLQSRSYPFPAVSELSKVDRLLLDRAWWLVRRFESETQGEGQGRKKDRSAAHTQVQGRRRGEALDYDVRPAGLDVDIIPDVSPSAEIIRGGTGTGPSAGPGPYRAPILGPDPGSVDESAERMLVSFINFLSEVSYCPALCRAAVPCSTVVLYVYCTALCVFAP
jgi:hypothetical protein